MAVLIEIQRLIGRSLRAVIDLKALGPKTMWIDCDVLQADGGTRTASITGAYIAAQIAIQKLISDKVIEKIRSKIQLLLFPQEYLKTPLF